MIDSGGTKSLTCETITIPGVGPTYTWILTIPPGYPPLPPLSGSGASVSVGAKAPGIYSVTFGARAERECEPPPIEVGPVTATVPPPSCNAVLGDGDGCKGDTIDIPCVITNMGQCETTFDWTVMKTAGTATVTPTPASGTVTLAAGASSNTPLSVAIGATSPLGSATLQLDVSVNGTIECADTGTVTVVEAVITTPNGDPTTSASANATNERTYSTAVVDPIVTVPCTAASGPDPSKLRWIIQDVGPMSMSRT